MVQACYKLRDFEAVSAEFAWVSTDKQSLQNRFFSHNESRKQSQDVMLYYHHSPLFISSSHCHMHPCMQLKVSGPQEVLVKLHRAKCAKSCNSFVLCLYRAVHVCFHGLSHRTNQIAFRAFLSLFDHLQTCWYNHLIHGLNFVLNDEISLTRITPNHTAINRS